MQLTNVTIKQQPKEITDDRQFTPLKYAVLAVAGWAATNVEYPPLPRQPRRPLEYDRWPVYCEVAKPLPREMPVTRPPRRATLHV